MAKILSIVWYKVLPARFGGQKGIAFFNDFLAKHYPMVCLCSRNNESTGDISYKLVPGLPVGKLQFINPFCWLKIIRAAKKEKCTHIILEHPYYAAAGYLAKKLTGIKLIVHSHNIEFLRFKEQDKWWWKLLFWYEKWAHSRADLNFFKTEASLVTAIGKFKLNTAKCIVVPFGVKQNIFLPGAKPIICNRHHIPLPAKILFFAGTLDYKPNANAVESIFKSILPRLLKNKEFNFKVIICGRNELPAFQYLRDLQYVDVIMAGEVDDIENYFAAADVFINPVMTGNGVQTKTMEALSHNCNVVCFRGRCEGILSEFAGDKLFAAADNDWDDFVKQVFVASRSSSLTPDSFFEHYGWERIVQVASDRIHQL